LQEKPKKNKKGGGEGNKKGALRCPWERGRFFSRIIRKKGHQLAERIGRKHRSGIRSSLPTVEKTKTA